MNLVDSHSLTIPKLKVGSFSQSLEFCDAGYKAVFACSFNTESQNFSMDSAVSRSRNWSGLLFLKCAILLGIAQAQAPSGSSWQKLLAEEKLSPDEKKGALFLSKHLDYAKYAALEASQRKHLLSYAVEHSDGDPALVLCWGKGTPEKVVEAYQAVEQAGFALRREDRRPAGIGTAFQADLADHWARTATNGSGQSTQGQPVTLTWSFVPDGTVIPGGEVNGEGTNEASDLQAWLAGVYNSNPSDPPHLQPWFTVFEAAFQNIASLTGVRYVYEPNDDGATLSQFSAQGSLGVRGDIRISGHALDGNSNVLAYNYFPDYGDMVIDTSDNFFDSLANGSQRLRNVVEHEHGHGLGLAHVCPVNNTKLMEPFINLGFTGCQFDEVYTLNRLYADPLEVHGSVRNNDSFANATPLNVLVNEPFSKQWLSIDDNTDVDYFRFDGAAGTQLRVSISPSLESYLEGPQNRMTGECTAGTTFDSSSLQDLSLEIISSDQSTVLASASGQPAGSMEEVSSLILPANDHYFIKVQGGSADFSQLYRIEIDVTAPSSVVSVKEIRLNRELFSEQNGVPDPGETIELAITLENLGTLDALNVSAVLSPPPGSANFDVVKSYGNLASGESGAQNFVFAPVGDCGEEIELSLSVTADTYNTVIPFTLTLGDEQAFITENFDSSPDLVNGWTSSLFRKGSGWSVVSNASSSQPNAAFAENASQAGSSTLLSPVINVGENPGSLSFRHFYDTEAGYDGGVLEINVANGGWQDILDSGATFSSGGYNLALAGTNNPLQSRSGWSGNSGVFILTTVALPPSVANQSIQFRFILGHDNRVGVNGWYIDDVIYNNFTCDESGAALLLSAEDGTASEISAGSDTAEISVSAILPVGVDMPVSLISSGSADQSLDVTGFGDLILGAGNDSASLTLAAVNDGLVEGPESLTISSPDASGEVVITILDTPYGTWAAAQLGLTGANGPFEDFDGDGSINVEELMYGTDGSLPSSIPSTILVPSGANFELSVPLATLPEGVIVEAEASTDLVNWTSNGISRLENGFLLDGSNDRAFIRLIYDVLDGAP